MSRYYPAPKDKGLELVVGYDTPLRHFFAQIFDADEELIGGWPSKSGLGVQDRIQTEEQATTALYALSVFIVPKMANPKDWEELRKQLLEEWRNSPDDLHKRPGYQLLKNAGLA